MSCGVYEIANLINGNLYIGSSVNIDMRWKEHHNCLMGDRHGNEHLQRAWNKYGEDSFEFNVLFYTDKKDVRMFEQRALDRLQPEYNIEKEVNGVGCRRSEETKRKVSKSLMGHSVSEKTRKKMREHKRSDEHRRKLGLIHKGTRLTEEHKRKISVALMGENNHNYGRCFSKEHRRKIGEASNGHKMSDKNKKDLSERMMGNKLALGHSHIGLNKGKTPWNKGKETGAPSKETKKKISESLKLYWAKRKEVRV